MIGLVHDVERVRSDLRDVWAEMRLTNHGTAWNPRVAEWQATIDHLLTYYLPDIEQAARDAERAS